MLLLFLRVALAAPSSEALLEAWTQQMTSAGSLPHFSVRLEERDFQRMARDSVAKRRLHQKGADRVVGAIWSNQPRDALWIAILDDAHDTLVKSLEESRLPAGSRGYKRLYQHLDLPWPFTDRHWVIDIRNNPALYASTNGAVWERTWELAEPTDTSFADPNAIWTPVNDGGWLLVDAVGGTIVVYHVRTYIGGAIPPEAVTRWAMTTLEDMLQHVVNRAREIPTHYKAGHTPIQRPDTSNIPGF